MKLFGDEVNHTSTNSPLNILQVENFSEIFFGVFEVELNGQRYPVEKVSEYKGNPVVHIPTKIVSIIPNVSINMDRPMTLNGSNSLTYRALDTSLPLMKGWSVSG